MAEDGLIELPKYKVPKNASKLSIKSNSSTQNGSLDEKRRRKSGRKEINVISVTVMFSLNFVIWNSIRLYYYSAYLFTPTTRIFGTLTGNNRILETYLFGWFYYATFMASCVNPLIHFVCNSKMRNALRQLTPRWERDYQ